MKDSPHPLVLNDRLCLFTKLAKIFKANTVDAGRAPAFPAAPHQACNIQEKGSVVIQNA